MHFSILLLPLVASLASAVPTTSSSDKPTVTLDYTTVQAAAGNETLGYYKYQNIRFAAVPTGDLRFAKPQWPSKESGINNGTTYATADIDCSSEEDCLYMDVWAPAMAKGKKLPVMVWTYGGGFTGGSKSQNTPEGLFDLSKEFIFVSFNYRLGITGIANSVTLTHQGATDNVALYDVEHAYKWVKKYISKFGGNPDDITAFGFSAGGSMPPLPDNPLWWTQRAALQQGLHHLSWIRARCWPPPRRDVLAERLYCRRLQRRRFDLHA